MSHSARLADYRAVLSTPGAKVPVIGALLARLPIAMVGLALLFYVQARTGSFATSGAVSAGALIGVAAGSVVQGRIMDRLTPTRPLLIVSVLFAIAVTTVIIAIESHAATPVLIALAFVIGITEPNTGSASRALWTHLIPPGPARDAAIAYEAISMEVFFILGPALAGVLIAAPWPGTGVVSAAACMILGAVVFALAPAVRRQEPIPTEHAHPLGAFAAPGMRTVALAAFGFGATIGFVEVAIPAAATHAGQKPLGGLLLAMWSLSSVVFGLWYATRPYPREMRLRLPVLLAAFALLTAPLALGSNLALLAILLLPAGILITPQATAHSAAIELVAPKGTVTEAFGWVITAVTLGLALGQSISGVLVDNVGIWSSFLAASAAGLVIAAWLWARRGTLGQPTFKKIGLVNATMESEVVGVGTGRRTSARTHVE
jgi:MFS family permease